LKKIFFLVNDFNEFNFNEYIQKYLKKIDISIGTTLPAQNENFDLIILWNYRKIIKNISKKNIILFHSSELPDGKGWAPIYYAIKNRKKNYVISGIFADNKVDSGDIIVQAKFQIKDNHTAEFIRKLDSEISIMLIKKILIRFNKKQISGKKQIGKISYNLKRNIEDNKIDVNTKFSSNIDHLRACEQKHPAFFYKNKTKYLIFVEPIEKPNFPKDLEIKFFN